MEVDNCATSPKPMNNGDPQDDGDDFVNESPRREDSIVRTKDENIEEVAVEGKILEPLHIADCEEISSEVTKQAKPSKGTPIKRSKKAVPIISSNDQHKRISSQLEGSRVSGNLGNIRTRRKPQRKKESNLVSNNRGNVSKRIDQSPKPLTVAAPLTCAEYAQCLGLQPAVKFKCHKCGETNFASIGMLRDHQADCSGVVDNTSEEAESCASLATSGSNLLITQQLILCSACDIYFNSFHSLFLHMQSVHRRHICLFCLKVFSRAERLASHIVSTHGASEASHPSADAFRSSRQSPCLLLCCTCERLFSDGDEFFDHSCRSGGLEGSSSDDVGRSVGGGDGSGRNESSSGGGKCGGSGGPDKSYFPDTSTEGGFRNSNLSQETVELDSDSTVNNSTSSCQLNERVEDVKALGPKDNILVVVFEKSEQNSDDILMRIECKDHLEADSEDIASPEEDVGSDKDVAEDLTSQESRQTLLVKEENDKIDDENSLQEASDSRITETAMNQREDDRKSPELENGPKGDVDTCSKSGIDEEDSGQREANVDEVMEGLDEHEKQMENDLSSEEIAGKDIDNDQSLSEMSEDSQEDENEEKYPALCCRSGGEISEDNALSKSQDSSVKYDSDSRSCSENIVSNVNGTTNVSESPKLLREDSDPPEKLDTLNESNDDKRSQPDDEIDSDEKVINEVQTNNNEIQSQQNGITSSPSVVNTSNEMNDTIDDSGGIQLAGEEVPLTVLQLEKDLEDYSIQDLLKEAVKATCFSCVYCTHAKKIAVNGKQLAYHLLAEHRFQPVVSCTTKNEDSDTDALDSGHICVEKFEEDKSAHDNFVKKDSVSDLAVDQKAIVEFVDMLKSNLTKLEGTCFNSDSYDNSDTSASKVFCKTYECFQCRFSTGLHKELYIHNRKMHQKTNLLCIMCKCTFYSYSELLCHLCPGVYVPNERPKFRCCFCSADSLPSAFRFMVHLRKRHHACDVCLEVTGDQQRLSGHVWKHKLNHLCYRCDIAYRNKPDITKHLFWKHGTESVLCKRCLQKKWPHVYHFCVPPAVFTCEECGSTFSRAVALRVHRRLHLGEAPHACPECGQHFISKRLVTRHQEIKHSDIAVKQAALSDSENPTVSPKLQPGESSLVQNDPDDAKDKKELEASLDDAVLSHQKSEDNVEKVAAAGYPSGSDETSFEHQESNNEDNCEEKKDTKVVVEPQVESQAASPGKEAKPTKKVVDVMDLPPLNLSSESDDSDEENAPSKSEAVDESLGTKADGEEEKQNEANCSSQPEEEEDTKPVEVVDGIWDNFKTYAAGLEVPKSEVGETASEASKGAFMSEDIGLVARIIKAEHDYCFPHENEEENVEKVEEESEAKVTETTKDKDQEDEFDHNYCSNNSKTDGGEVAQSFEAQETSPKKHPKSPKKRKKTGSGSSSSDASDSSDSDGSSCSCGTNCSCSSGSSSSASSSSGSGSESSASESGAARSSRREKKKESKRKRHVASGSRQEDKVGSQGEGEVQSPGSVKDGSSRVDAVMAEEEPPPLREVMIRESDLETDESETDEDFYDEQPRRFHANSSAAVNFARLAAGNSPAAVPLDDSTLPSPATSVQSPASRPASPPLAQAWRPTQPTPSTPIPPPPPPPVPVVEPEVKNSIDIIPEGFTPLIQPKKRGRKRKRPHLPTKLARKQADNVKCSSDPNSVPNISLKLGKNVKRNKVVPPQSYKNTPPIHVHSVHNSSGAILNSSMLHSVSEPSTPASVIEGDDGLRLSKRKRVPKRFYGDSSDEEGESASGNTSAGGGGFSGSSKFSFVVNQSGKIPKKKKSSLGPASSSHYPRESTGRASVDGMSHLQRPAYQYQDQDDVDDQGISMSSDRDEDESQNGRSEAESDAWSEDDSRNKDGPSCPLPSVSSPRPGNQMPGGESVGANTGSLYCYCQCPYDEVSEMIACDGKKCAIEWFHFECVGIMVPPKGKWYCPDCRKRCGSSGRTSDHLSGT